MTTSQFRVQGLDCADEATELRQTVGALAGVHELSFDYLRGVMIVDHDESVASRSRLMEAVALAGMRAEVWQDDALKMVVPTDDGRWRRSALTMASGCCLALAFVGDWWTLGWRGAFGGGESGQILIASVLYVIAALLGSLIVLPKAWSAVRRGRLEINVLMVIAVTGAIIIRQFAEAATVSFLFAVSLALEAWSVGRARRAVEALMKLAPETACVLQSDGTETIVPPGDVPVGATLVVRPGEKFPLDGRVQRGETSVNQAPITGESVPVAKRPGDDVFAGTINEDGAIEIVTTKPANDSTLARITRLVTDAQSKRSQAEQWVETFARYYTPAVIGLAVVVMLLPPLLASGSWTGWFYQGLVLLVIACPCALVISTPVSMVAALASAANQGVLVKGASFLELAAHLKAIALDKTGTLTEGRPEVKEIVALSGHTDNELLDIAAAIEARSQHPLAAAIVRHAESLGLKPKPADDFQAISGKGATATLAGQRYWIGSHRAFEERGQETPEMHDRLEQLAARGHSVVVIANDEHVCGLIALGDTVRANAKDALTALHRAGVNRIVMLTGDNPSAAKTVAAAVGVDDVRAELLPEDKVAAIEQLVVEHGQVGMIGDGVNDAPAMARATLGIAMGAVGTDTALETADIALMSDDLSRVAWLIRHSQRTLRIVRQNITASLVVKAVFVILTALGHANLWTAIAADMGVTLLVVFNSLRLLNSQSNR
ncbi:MAG: heavy metal translocating P-type ATPase [Planctomycetales bacterium]|nr:heavy metal translocating P-type ATPase [Planctomycetales bacterium]